MGHVCTMQTIKGPSSRAFAHWALQMQFKTQILRKTHRELSTSGPLKAEASTLSALQEGFPKGLRHFLHLLPLASKRGEGERREILLAVMKEFSECIEYFEIRLPSSLLCCEDISSQNLVILQKHQIMSILLCFAAEKTGYLSCLQQKTTESNLQTIPLLRTIGQVCVISNWTSSKAFVLLPRYSSHSALYSESTTCAS